MNKEQPHVLVGKAIEAAAGLFLFATTALIVWWQNSRLTVLYDLSGVLEPAARIAQGDLPYRDFPFPYAPLTFLTQAAIIRLTGAFYWHHILYCCVIAGLATVLTWRIISVLLADLPQPRLAAFVLSIPAALLGVYCIFPHPFYDPDAAFVILLCLWLLLRLERRGFPAVPAVIVGMLMAVPLFIKQNIGLAFLGSIIIWLALRTAIGLKQRTALGNILLFSGIVIGILSAGWIIHITCGVDNYLYWTFTFAAARRAPSIADMLAVYAEPVLAVWAAVFFFGAYVFAGNTDGRRSGYLVGVPLMAAPFLWPAVYLLIDTDASERAERLVDLWPLAFIAAVALSYMFIRRVKGVAAAFPFIIIATAHGVFLSQQLWGSTYGIWPLLLILIAIILRQLYDPDRPRSGIAVAVLGVLMAASLITAGSFYIYSNERLDYVDFEDGEMAHSTLPQLQGLSMRGDWIPDFEELVAYTDREIPRDAGILYLPGEDLFYYTTGRRPHFPVLLFDVTNNPYNAVEIRDKVLASDIEWVIIKNDTEIEADTMIDSKTAIFDLLKPEFRHVESLNNYEIYKRRHADDPPDEDEDDDSDDTDNSDN